MRSRPKDYVLSVRVDQEDYIRFNDLLARMTIGSKQDVTASTVLREALRLGMRALDPGPGKML
jgi:hypothetical protein